MNEHIFNVMIILNFEIWLIAQIFLYAVKD